MAFLIRSGAAASIGGGCLARKSQNQREERGKWGKWGKSGKSGKSGKQKTSLAKPCSGGYIINKGSVRTTVYPR